MYLIKQYIPPSIVLPVQQVGFNCDIFSLPEGYKGSPLHCYTIVHINSCVEK